MKLASRILSFDLKPTNKINCLFSVSLQSIPSQGGQVDKSSFAKFSVCKCNIREHVVFQMKEIATSIFLIKKGTYVGR